MLFHCMTSKAQVLEGGLDRKKSVTSEEAEEGMVCAEGWLGIGFLRLCLACEKTEYWHVFRTVLCRSAEECMSHTLNIIF